MTLGSKQLNFSLGYAFVDFRELNGTDLDNITNSALILDPSPKEAVPVFSRFCSSCAIAPVVLSELRTQIDLQAHIIAPSVRYGITTNWDVGVSIPIVNTFLRVRGQSIPRVVVTPSPGAGYIYSVSGGKFFPLGVNGTGKNVVDGLQFARSNAFTRPPLSKTAGSATGVGDIVLRSKYQFWQTEEGGQLWA